MKDSEETKKKKKGKEKNVSHDSDTDEEDVDQLEALLARRFQKEKANTKVSYPLFVSIVMKLVILQPSVPRRYLIRRETSTKIERKMMEKITKARSHATLLMKFFLMKMMMK